jgi:predicted DNA-binding transcriptional regulator AlpA
LTPAPAGPFCPAETSKLPSFLSRIDTMTTPSPYLDRREAARYLKISLAQLSKQHADGTGPTRIEVAGRVLYDINDLDAWMQAHKKELSKCV